MKLYKVKVIDRKTNEVLVDKEERAVTKKRLTINYCAMFKFHENVVSIEIERLTRKPGIQVSIFNVINENENGTN